MFKKIIMIVVVIVCSNNVHSQISKIKFKPYKTIEQNYLKVNDFYLTHYFYEDLFIKSDIYSNIKPEEIKAILNQIKKYVSPNNWLMVTIQKSELETYEIVFKISKRTTGVEVLNVFTNWNRNTKKFAKTITAEPNLYRKRYYTYNSIITNKKKKKEFSRKMMYSNMNQLQLANAYLFDEIIDNDSKVKSLINEVFEMKNVTDENIIWANLLLLQYYILEKEDSNVVNQSKYITELFEQNTSNTDLKNLNAIFEVAKFQIKALY